MVSGVTKLPLTGWQTFFRRREAMYEGVMGGLPFAQLTATVRVNPGIGDRRIKRAFQRLCNRHDITRIQFDWDHKTPFAYICNTHPTDVTFHDYDGIAKDQIEAVALSHTTDVVTMAHGPLVCLDVLKCGAHGDVFVFRAHHGITDGVGFLLLFEDFVKMLLGMPLAKDAVTHVAYCAGPGRDTPNAPAEHDQYWHSIYDPPAAPLMIGRPKAGMPFIRSDLMWKTAKSLHAHLSKRDIDRATDHAKKIGVTPFILMNTAFLDAVGAIAGSDDFYYTMTLARSDRRLARYAGHHTLHPLMRFRREKSDTLAVAAQRASEDLVTMMAHIPSPCARRELAWDRALMEQGYYPRQIATGLETPTQIIRQSPFADSLTKKEGSTFRIATFEIEKYETPIAAGDIDEIGFRPFPREDGGTLAFHFDDDVYSDQDKTRIADDTLHRLGTALSKFDWKV